MFFIFSLEGKVITIILGSDIEPVGLDLELALLFSSSLNFEGPNLSPHLFSEEKS